MSILPDPCSLPDREGKRRRLNEKERNIYAPFSGVGGIVYDKDAVYIDTGGSHSHNKEEEVGPTYMSRRKWGSMDQLVFTVVNITFSFIFAGSQIQCFPKY